MKGATAAPEREAGHWTGPLLSRYLLFAGSDYYPAGGVEDLKLTFQAVDGPAAVSIALDWVARQPDVPLATTIDWWELAYVGRSGLQIIEKEGRS